MLSKILPFLNKLLPEELAIKGLKKASPRIGNYLAGSFASGYTASQAIDYLRNTAQDAGYVDEEGRLRERRKKGSARADELASLSRMEKSKGVNKKLKQGAGLVAGALSAGTIGAAASGLGSLLGEGEEPQKGMGKKEATKFGLKKIKERKQRLMDQERERFSQAYGRQDLPQQSQGNDEEIVAALQQLLNM